MILMPRRVAKSVSAAGKAATSTEMKAKKHGLLRRAAQGTLLAAVLATAQFDDEGFAEKRRLFDSTVLDRLRAPLTRYHD